MLPKNQTYVVCCSHSSEGRGVGVRIRTPGGELGPLNSLVPTVTPGTEGEDYFLLGPGD